MDFCKQHGYPALPKVPFTLTVVIVLWSPTIAQVQPVAKGWDLPTCPVKWNRPGSSQPLTNDCCSFSNPLPGGYSHSKVLQQTCIKKCFKKTFGERSQACSRENVYIRSIQNNIWQNIHSYTSKNKIKTNNWLKVSTNTVIFSFLTLLWAQFRDRVKTLSKVQ